MKVIEQLSNTIRLGVYSLQLRWDAIWFKLGVHQFPLQSYREIRTGCKSEKFSRDYLYRTNAFTTNSICTAKYNVLTFLPRAIFEQFRRVANLYFLLISVLMAIGTYTEYFDSPLDPWSTFFPLIVVIGVSMVKEGAEDMKRHRGDKETNNCEAAVLVMDEESGGEPPSLVSEPHIASVNWHEVRVGDILYMRNNEKIAADVVLLTSSDEASGGAAYVETANIDGETNLKIRIPALGGVSQASLDGIKEKTDNGDSSSPSVCKKHWLPNDVARSTFLVQCDHPNSNIHHFKGSLSCNGHVVSVDSRHLMLRGSEMCNTSWAVGLVVYTGHQSKMVLNSRRAPSKLSFIEKIMNKLVMVVFTAQLIVSVTSLICYVVWTMLHYDVLAYLCFESSNDPSVNPIYKNCKESNEYSNLGYFFTFYILFNNFIPISLYMTVEFSNYLQAYYIDNDLKMYDQSTDTPAVARTSNMNGDLGMVDYIFSDKTGTLTQNIMEFNECSIGGSVFVTRPIDNEENSVEGVQYKTMEELRKLASVSHSDGLALLNMYTQFVLVLSVAHTVIIEPTTKEYMAESPDEEALVKAGKDMGWEFWSRGDGCIEVAHGALTASSLRLKVLATIPFDSTRKRMSVVIQQPGSEDALVLSKGADNVMLERAVAFAPGSSEESLKLHLDEFAKKGLRTLVLAKRHLTKDELSSFMAKWQDAERSMTNREDMLSNAAMEVECNFTILGATAIEDKLQDNVPETIEDLRNAGIKLWVLTGDKVETAINIGFSCRLLRREMLIIRLQDSSDEQSTLENKVKGLLQKLKDCANDQFNSTHHDSKLTSSSTSVSSLEGYVDITSVSEVEISSEHLALVVDGELLTKILGNRDLKALFLELACMCRAVLACRVSPEQKRMIVRMVKRKGTIGQPQAVTLAIGDGANDVAMIQEAQIGVGISGREGRQAVNNADFALPQFQNLKRLLLVHGRIDYRRVSKVILFSFYKNIVLTITMFLFTLHSGLSGQSLYDGYLYSSYNFVLALPVIGFGIFDQDLSPAILEKYPVLYITSREQQDMNIFIMIRMTLQAIFEGVLIFYSVFYAFEGNNGAGDDGLNGDIWVFGTSVYTALILTQILRCIWLTYTWNYVSVLFILASIAIYFTFLGSYQYFLFFDNFFRVTSHVLRLRIVWVIALLVPITAILIEVFFTALIREFSPDLLSVCIEHDRGYGKRTKRPESSNETDAEGTISMSPFYHSLHEEMSCLFDWDLDSSRSAMLPSSHSDGRSDAFTDTSRHSRGSKAESELELDPDEAFTASLVEGMRPKAYSPRRRRRRRPREGCCDNWQHGFISWFLRFQERLAQCVGGLEASESESRPAPFSLNWASLSSLQLLASEDAAAEGPRSVQVEDTSKSLASFNFDYVTSDYGPGAARFLSQAYDSSIGVMVQKIQQRFGAKADRSQTKQLRDVDNGLLLSLESENSLSSRQGDGSSHRGAQLEL